MMYNKVLTNVILILILMPVFILAWNRLPLAENTDTNKISKTGQSSIEEVENTNMQKATFAAGCFWGVEATFRQVKGVVSTSVGYTGGTGVNPTYREVCGGNTGHAEAVEVIYDPSQVGYEQLLDIFWNGHDPTTLNQQGPDIGSQYRSAIFYHDADQEKSARTSIEQLNGSGKFDGPIVTEVVAAGSFYQAEDSHQKYYEKRGLSSCGVKK